MFKRILIANRGEIALRVMRSCHEMGIEVVCVFSHEDRGAGYLELADRTICIGPASPADSYLRSDRIIAAAEIAGADAIHPGYGFLAENARFADQCRECNIEFIGPSAEAMRQLGDKATARIIAKKAKVTTVPGSDGVLEDDAAGIALAEKIGYPVMVKASAGGGGRGLRIARNREELEKMLGQARQEAMVAFKDDALYLEKYIERPRHVEVQILADTHGKVVHLFERDCTVQRRYQKLIEESPSPGIENRTRTEICKAAVRLAQAAGYTNAGTFEFVVNRKGKAYFIEANARIQVEHPVTEMVTGIDLVDAQIRIAAGEKLPFSQRDIRRNGVAIECRINAEDPSNDFRPCAGTIERFRPCGGFGVRVDSHAHDGYRISPRYDSLIGKLIVHRPTRNEAVTCMQRCLDEFVVDPVKTTIPLYQAIFHNKMFISGKFDTGFVEHNFPS